MAGLAFLLGAASARLLIILAHTHKMAKINVNFALKSTV